MTQDRLRDFADAPVLFTFQGDVLHVAIEAEPRTDQFQVSVISRVGADTVLVPHARITVDADGAITDYERVTDEWAIGDMRIRSWLAPHKATLAKLATDPPPPP
ncbi:hypothetical protein [Glycomyces salinus]|uniref:hypothetical protein n=1 Tax=Glycomyces salinus TaxID=980294 RepID=UPI0018EA9264|nr:hypothetical protein [Glycomyces salinus]